MIRQTRQIPAPAIFPPNILEYMGLVRIDVGGVAAGNVPATVVITGAIDDVPFSVVATPDNSAEIDGFNYETGRGRKVRINAFDSIDNAGAATTCRAWGTFVVAQ